MGFMGLFGRRRSRPKVTQPQVDPEVVAHLEAFVRTRRGVEGFVEPTTAMYGTTLLLVAYDGEWTRRRIPSVAWAHRFANDLGVPSYDAALVGIPTRMREYNRRQRAARRAEPAGD